MTARTADEVVSLLPDGAHVFVHGASATPTVLLDALRRSDRRGLTFYHLHTTGPAPFAEPAFADRFRSVSLFTGPDLRRPVAEGWADFVPVFLSDIPDLFRSGRIRLDAALVQLSPPDRHGIASLGTSVDAALAAVEAAPLVLAEVNQQMPRTLGAGQVPMGRVDAWVETDRPLHEIPPAAQGEVEAAIGAQVAALVPDGATLQMGIGAIPDAVLARLGDKNDLGVHTEMFSDGLLPLLRSGVVTNRRKKVHPGRTVTSFVTGTAAVFAHVHDNPLVEFHPCDRTNDTTLIAKNDRAVAINSALAVDLSGQVCADSLGHTIFSGIGGQMDFIRGAARSREGVPVIALPSTASGGRVSRITATLQPGSGVVTTRGHVHWVVTEHGAVNLHGLTLRQRAERLITIAHPDVRADLRRDLLAIRHYDLGA